MDMYEKEEQLGFEFFSNADGKNAIKHYKLAIKYGSQRAYAYIGELYLYGICGIKKNLKEAMIYINLNSLLHVVTTRKFTLPQVA